MGLLFNLIKIEYNKVNLIRLINVVCDYLNYLSLKQINEIKKILTAGKNKNEISFIYFDKRMFECGLGEKLFVWTRMLGWKWVGQSCEILYFIFFYFYY